MKYCIPMVFLTLAQMACLTAPVNMATQEQRTMEKTLRFDGYRKQQIYDRSLQWIDTTFIFGKAHIECRDPDEGRITGTVMIPYHKIPGYYIRTGLEIDMKDTRSRMTLTAINVSGPPAYDTSGVDLEIYGYDQEVRAVRTSMHDMIRSYSDYVLNAGKNDER
ncbi:MAG: DUF4468 domain-containing protein [Spirochaetes bacterium]|nr:DUF4468 domain-containing protein [Spirochaetota bacterium]